MMKPSAIAIAIMSALRTPATEAVASLAPPNAANDDWTGLVIGVVILLGIVIAARALWGIHAARKIRSEQCVLKAVLEFPVGTDVSYTTILKTCKRRFPDVSVSRIDGAIYRLTVKGDIRSSAGADESLMIRALSPAISAPSEAA
jgi:hypothetical protein